MNITFLNPSLRSDRLILIFSGWSCGADLYHDFTFPGWEIAVVDDYSSLSFDIAELERFSTIYLFAWSLGVFMASTIDFRSHITAAVAINGTLKPADDLKGIPRDIFVKTAENLTPRNLIKFRRRMAGESDIFNQIFKKEFSVEESSGLRNQLFSILDWQESHPSYPLPWKKVFISENDAIFPYKNMRRFWEDESIYPSPKTISLRESHYVPMERIVKMTIPEVQTLARRFSGAAASYNSNAEAQRKLSTLLAEMLFRKGLSVDQKILEIGCGTGIFTQEIINLFSPRELVMVDISDVRPDTSNINSRFHKADAEKWIADSEERFDAVVSSATVQWFVNLPLFFSNVYHHLEDDGILGFSTFLSGNLYELDSLRPSPLHYHTSQEIRIWLERWFEEIEVIETEYILNFDTYRQLFDHLRSTGVGGSAPVEKLSISLIKEMRQLTFKCGCFVAKKKNKEIYGNN
ncbi:MAG: DUF452 family protein [Muribaculaceae bacterium]|nr:DUF452 family protein [Muribaculaceae bacterium]